MAEACTTMTWPGHYTDAYGPGRCQAWHPDMFEAKPGVATWCPLCCCWTIMPALRINFIGASGTFTAAINGEVTHWSRVGYAD